MNQGFTKTDFLEPYGDYLMAQAFPARISRFKQGPFSKIKFLQFVIKPPLNLYACVSIIFHCPKSSNSIFLLPCILI